MSLGALHGVEDLRDRTFLVDDEGRPIGVAFWAHHAVDLGEFLLVVRQQREGKFFLVGEFLLLGKGIDADADNCRVILSKLLEAVTETASFRRSAAG
jgi:hypothetical protein